MIQSCRSLLAGDSARPIACRQAPAGRARASVLVAAVFALSSGLAAADATAPAPQIELWYGDEQRFGHLGNPQVRINLVGVVSAPHTVESLVFSLNGGPPRWLSTGPNGFRLSRPGAFNAEIERTDLRPGENIVTFTAQQRFNNQPVTKTVHVNYTAGRTWPLPYTIKWHNVRRIEEVAEVMDGHWKLTPDGVRTLDPYYDRVIAIGDMSWTDYEVLTSVIFHQLLADVIVPKGPPFSNHGHASLLLRWLGHPDDGKQPRRQWRPCGGLAMWRADAGTEGVEWHWNCGESGIVAREGRKRPLELGRRYMIRGRVETLPGPKTRYSIKGWDARQPEPNEWDLVGIDGEQDLQAGSLLLVAHHSDVTFGDVEVFALRKPD